jgi:hypothetical protein
VRECGSSWPPLNMQYATHVYMTWPTVTKRRPAERQIIMDLYLHERGWPPQTVHSSAGPSSPERNKCVFLSCMSNTRPTSFPTAAGSPKHQQRPGCCSKHHCIVNVLMAVQLVAIVLWRNEDRGTIFRFMNHVSDRCIGVG